MFQRILLRRTYRLIARPDVLSVRDYLYATGTATVAAIAAGTRMTERHTRAVLARMTDARLVFPLPTQGKTHQRFTLRNGGRA